MTNLFVQNRASDRDDGRKREKKKPFLRGGHIDGNFNDGQHPTNITGYTIVNFLYFFSTETPGRLSHVVSYMHAINRRLVKAAFPYSVRVTRKLNVLERAHQNRVSVCDEINSL